MCAWRGNQRAQSHQETTHREHRMSTTVRVRVPEAIQDPPAGVLAQPFGREGRPGHVAAEMLQSTTAVRGHGHSRVQAEALSPCHEGGGFVGAIDLLGRGRAGEQDRSSKRGEVRLPKG